MRCMRKAGDYRELLYVRSGRRDNGVDVKWDVKMQNGVKQGEESRVGEIRRCRVLLGRKVNKPSAQPDWSIISVLSLAE